jgi:hypothetical protein
MMLSTVFILSVALSPIYGSSLRYNVRDGLSYIYEVKYAIYPENSALDAEMKYPLNTSMMRIDLVQELVYDTNDGTESIGLAYLNYYYLKPGSAWETVATNVETTLSYSSKNDLETEDVYTNISIEDTQVTREKIINFFRTSQVVIPIALSEAQKDKVMNDMARRLYNGFGGAAEPTKSRTANTLDFTMSNVGPNNLRVTASYNLEDGALDSWILKSSNTTSRHTIFSVSRLVPNITIQEEKQTLPGYPFEIVAICSIFAIIKIIRKTQKH